MQGQDNRGQAFTLEGFVASVVVLTAILLALQSVVLTPTTGGAVDQQVQGQLRTEATDILKVTSSNYSDCRPGNCPPDKSHDLSYIVRHWNGTDRSNAAGLEDTWAFARSRTIGYGSDQPLFHELDLFGEALNGSFASRGYVYNVVIEYRNATDANRSDERRLVYRGVPSNNAIVTEFTVTLYDNQTLTGPNPDCTDDRIEEINPVRGGTEWNSSVAGCYFPIPEQAAFDDDTQDPSSASACIPAASSLPVCENTETEDDPIYNVVEIRVIVW